MSPISPIYMDTQYTYTEERPGILVETCTIIASLPFLLLPTLLALITVPPLLISTPAAAAFLPLLFLTAMRPVGTSGRALHLCKKKSQNSATAGFHIKLS